MDIHTGATTSIDGVYRYTLTRALQPSMLTDPKRVLFCMLNPSTADAHSDDPTIRRCMGFAAREGATVLDVWNLYGLRSASPSALIVHDDPVGPNNDAYLPDLLARADLVIVAWGAWAPLDRESEAWLMLESSTPMCLGTTKGGAPRHPLYVRADQPLEPWAPGGE